MRRSHHRDSAILLASIPRLCYSFPVCPLCHCGVGNILLVGSGRCPMLCNRPGAVRIRLVFSYPLRSTLPNWTHCTAI
ncbi:hypothetical protein OE88DRAFT_727095 [Heliocybe sulcata]|uniref:Secreted protein n=1 Tax=Heliocybe sulcata TaxID=5364 RepID=A0A5C3NHD6_9AGAM|nr:hypothetical protein OE88DRAFT_727095 [Heliocybe sulcata]